MNKNVKIARELIKIAKCLVAGNQVANEKGKYENFTGIINWKGTEGIVMNATFELVPDGSIYWYDGTWKGGTWITGRWYDGTWENGTWKGGQFRRGVWNDGTWENGIWYGTAKWKDGTWIDGKTEGVVSTLHPAFSAIFNKNNQ